LLEAHAWQYTITVLVDLYCWNYWKRHLKLICVSVSSWGSPWDQSINRLFAYTNSKNICACSEMPVASYDLQRGRWRPFWIMGVAELAVMMMMKLPILTCA